MKYCRRHGLRLYSSNHSIKRKPRRSDPVLRSLEAGCKKCFTASKQPQFSSPSLRIRTLDLCFRQYISAEITYCRPNHIQNKISFHYGSKISLNIYFSEVQKHIYIICFWTEHNICGIKITANGIQKRKSFRYGPWKKFPDSGMQKSQICVKKISTFQDSLKKYFSALY